MKDDSAEVACASRPPAGGTIKAFTYFSPSHEIFVRKLFASFPWEPNLELHIKFLPQEGDGKYHNDAWKDVMRRKVRYIIESLNQTAGEDFMLHLDSDIVFFAPVYQDLLVLMAESRAEILFQNDKACFCMGCFIAKKTPATLRLFEDILANLHAHQDDQYALNSLLPCSGVKFGLLPKRYYSIGLNNHKWGGRSELSIPTNINLLHANWVEGTENKLKLIALVEEKMRRKAAPSGTAEPVPAP